VSSIWRKKELVLSTASKGVALKKELGLFDLVLLALGSAIGVGIFVLTGRASVLAGPSVSISLLIAGLACALSGLAYAEFASLVPRAGSVYTYAYVTLGELFAWILGWNLALNYAVQVGTVAAGWSCYLQDFMQMAFNLKLPNFVAAAPGTNSGSFFNLPVFLLCLLLTLLLARGIKESKLINNVIVLVKVGILMLFIIVGGLCYINFDNWQPFFSVKGWPGLFSASAFLFLAYVGFEDVAAAVEEAKNPQRDVPRALFISLGIITLLYVLMALVMTGILPVSELTKNPDNPLALIITHTNRLWGAVLYAGLLVGIPTGVLASLYGLTRLVFSMARDGLLPAKLGELHNKYKTPFKGTWFVGLLVGILGSLTPLKNLADLTDLSALVAFSFVSLSVWLLRVREPNLVRPFRMPGLPWLPILSLIINGYLMFSLEEGALAWLIFVCWAVIGLAVYFSYAKKNSVLNR
jgi:APA family basic amino acid/polyamine antiporter